MSIRPGVREPVARPLAGVLGRLAFLWPGLPFGPQAAFIARAAAGSDDGAAVLAGRLGTVTSARRRSRRDLARLALVVGRESVAAEILGSLGEDRGPDLELMRSRLAFTTGRYRDAERHARVATEGGAPGAERLLEKAIGQLTVLEPGWRPDLARERLRLEGAGRARVPGRVLHVVSTSQPYQHAGYTVRTLAVTRCQRAAGLDPHVAVRHGLPPSVAGRPERQPREVGGSPTWWLQQDPTSTTPLDVLVEGAARAAVDLVEELRPAVLQPATNHLQAQIALAIGRPAGIPVVYEVRGFWEESWAADSRRATDAAMASDHYTMTRAAETAAMQAADAVVTLSETMRSEIAARGVAADRIVVVPNAVDVERFRPAPRDARLAATLGIEPTDVVVGYISSFSAYEGIPTLLEAAAVLSHRPGRLRVLLVGDGAEGAAISAAGRRLGLDDGTLVMPGRVPHAEVAAYHTLIDVFVVPRTNDRVSRLVTPLKPFEAMATGRAVVVSDVPALREIVAPGETGATFRAEDAGDLARVLGELLDDPPLRARLGARAREWVVAERTWDANGRRYRELFERLGAA
jgi:glycosyltransferase involved in cell wall biosynthesis